MSNDSKAVSAPADSSTEGVANLSAEGAYAEILRRSTPREAAETVTEETPETNQAPETQETVAEAEPTEEQAEPSDEAAESEDKEQQADTEETPEEDVPSQLPDKVQKAVNKRIGKEVAKRKAAEEAAQKRIEEAERRAAELEEKLRQSVQQQAEPPVVTASPDDPLANVNTPDELDKRRSQARDVVRTVEEVLDDAVEDDEGRLDIGGQKFTRQQLKQIARNARRDLEDNIPKRERFIAARAKATELAVQEFPWIKDPTSPKYLAATSEYKRRPYLAQDPESLYNVALAIEGRFAIEERKAAAKKATEEKKPTATPPKVDVTPKVVPAKKPTPVIKDQKAAARRAEVTKANMTSDDVYSLMLQNELSKAGES